MIEEAKRIEVYAVKQIIWNKNEHQQLPSWVCQPQLVNACCTFLTFSSIYRLSGAWLLVLNQNELGSKRFQTVSVETSVTKIQTAD